MGHSKAIVFFIMLGIVVTATAQEKTVNKQNEQWIQYYNQIKLSEKWAILTDGGFRWRDGFNESSQYIVRTGANYKLNTSMSATLGIAHVGFYNSNSVNRIELRPYQEFNITNKYNYLSIQHRIRVEERIFYPVVDGKILSSSDFNFRFRYRLLFNIPIFKLSATDSNKTVSLSVGDEIMINAGPEIVNNVFDQNRFLIGPIIQFDENISASITYNNQFAATRKAGTYNYTEVIWLGIQHKLNFEKQEKLKTE